MAKGNKSSRKRSRKPVNACGVRNKQADKNKLEEKEIAPINQQELQYLKGIVEISNSYAKLRQQYSQYEKALSAVKKNRKKVQKGEYKSLNIPVSPEVTTTIRDKAEMLKYLNNQVKQLEIALSGIEGQLKNRKDLYVETGLRLENFVKKKFGKFRITKIASDRGGRIEEEQKIFEAEFDELMKNEEKKKEFKEAMKKAKKENKKKTAKKKPKKRKTSKKKSK